MNTVLYCSTKGAVYETRAYTQSDIDQLVSGRGLQCLTSTDGQFDFWFSPVTPGCQRRGNQIATELLLATTSFSAKNVPLLRGCVVIASHDSDGTLDGLSWAQLHELARRNGDLSARDERVVARRIARTAAPAAAARRTHRTTAAKTRSIATPAPVPRARVSARS